MKKIILILAAVAAVNVFVAIRFRQPMGFILAAAAGAVAVYLYLTSTKKENYNAPVEQNKLERKWCKLQRREQMMRLVLFSLFGRWRHGGM